MAENWLTCGGVVMETTGSTIIFLVEVVATVNTLLVVVVEVVVENILLFVVAIELVVVVAGNSLTCCK